MLKGSRHRLQRVLTSLKVLALVTVLGTVVMAAERHLATRISPEEIIATSVAPAHMPSSQSPAPASAAPERDPPADYFPSQFDESKGKADEQPPTF